MNWERKLWIMIFVVLATYFIIFSLTEARTPEQTKFAELVLEMAYEAKMTNGLPASITAAIIILESGWGEHIVGNNYFGIKSDGTQPYVLSLTYEYDSKTKSYYQIVAKFRKYDNLLESIMDYGRFIYDNPRYSEAIANRFNPVDYIYEIQKAGYATGLNYANKVLMIAEQCGFLTVSKWIVK